MRTLNHLLMGGCLTLLGLVGNGQARDWSFARDTVVENQAGTTSVLNSGAQLLRFDSLYLERIQSTFEFTRFGFTISDSVHTAFAFSSVWTCPSVGSCGAGQAFGFDTTKVQQSKSLFNFGIDYGVPSTAETQGTGVGDTLKYRAIIVAKNGRGRDTLFVVGIQQNPVPSSIALPGILGGKKSDLSSKLFDLRGRRVEKIPEGLKAPWAPVVSPRE